MCRNTKGWLVCLVASLVYCYGFNDLQSANTFIAAGMVIASLEK